MKCAVITRYFPNSGLPYDGQSAYQTLRLLSQMAEVKVFSAHATYPFPFAKPKWRENAKLQRDFRVEGVDCEYVTYPALPVLTRGINGYTCTMAVERQIYEGRFDAILNYWVYPDGFAAVRLGKRLGIPSIVTAIGSDVNEMSGVLTRRLTRHTLHEASRVVTVSGALRNEVIYGFGVPSERVHAIRNGIDPLVFHHRSRAEARTQLQLEPQTKYLLYVGRMDNAKGLRELVEAVAEIGKEVPVKVLMIGSGPDKEGLRQLAAQLHVSEHVIFVGNIPNRELGIWMAASDLFVLPSYAEGCPNVLVEALACGLPVVASYVGGIPELVDQECGILVPARSTAALAVGLRQALQWEWDRRWIAANHCRSWQDVAQDLYRVIEDAIAGEKSGRRLAGRSRLLRRARRDDAVKPACVGE